MGNANLILLSNAIFDSVHDEPFEGGIAIENEKILFVGSKKEALSFAAKDAVIRNFGDRLIMPGFIDAHGHFVTSAIREYGSCISYLELARSEQEVVEGVRKYVNEHPGITSVHGRCWMICSWGPGAPEPTKDSLDREFPDLPVYLLSSNGHVAWLNSAALKESDVEGILREHPDWEIFVRRDADGELTGFLTENVSYAVRWAVEVYSKEEHAACQEKFLRLLNEHGVTGFADCDCKPTLMKLEETVPVRELEKQGRLKMRFFQWSGTNVAGDAGDGAFEKGVQDLLTARAHVKSDRFFMPGYKIMLDGVPDSYTGAMLEPYAGNPSTSGECLAEHDAYLRCVTYANSKGLSVKAHCLGDRSVRWMIDACEESARTNGTDFRNSIEHMPIIRDEDIDRMARLNILASVQPAHMPDWFGECGEEIYGPELAGLESRYRTLKDRGVRVVLGTDTPVVSYDPLHTVYECVTRKNSDGVSVSPKTEDQALTLAETLKGYTIEAAYANFAEDRLGSLEPGKLADVIVIDRNLFAVPPEEIDRAKNVCTVFNGEIIYEG